MSKSCKIILIALGALVVACILFTVISSLIPEKESLASHYGITDNEKSALVIKNDSNFYILDVKITGSAEAQWTDLIGKSIQKVYPISPGKYTVFIHYSDHTDLDDLSFMEWYVSSIASGEFDVVKRRAVIYLLEGGHSSGMMYDPPDLIKK